jgi:hypothetical protein
MATDVQLYVPLKRVVSYFLEQNDKDFSYFDKCWIIAFRALVALNFSISAEPVSVRLPVQANKTVILPSDYLAWTKIGVLNNNGEVSTLKVNNSLAIFRDNNPNRLEDLTPDVCSSMPLIASFPYFFNFFDNGLYYNLFGIGGGLIQYGECRIDEKNGLILLDQHFHYDRVILEYMSSPQKNNDYTIPIQLQEAVIAFIEWKLKLNTDQNYYARVIEGRRSLPNKRVTLQEVNTVIREATGQYLKA